MSHNNHSENNTPKKTNYLLRIIFAFVYALVLGALLHLLIGTQQCNHCSTCSSCNECTESAAQRVNDAGLGGKEEGESCKKKDACTKEHECGDEKGEEKKEGEGADVI